MIVDCLKCGECDFTLRLTKKMKLQCICNKCGESFKLKLAKKHRVLDVRSGWMKVVIDIPDDFYEKVQDNYRLGNGDVVQIPIGCIANSTPLPKGHGDLIDRGQALNECYDITIDGDVFTVVQYETLLGVPTIIEADTESEAENE